MSSETHTAQWPREGKALARVAQQTGQNTFAPVFLSNLGL